MEAEFKAVRGGTGVDPVGCPCTNRTPLAAGDKEMGMSISAAVDSKREVNGSA